MTGGASDRIVSLDLIRGIAVLGILFANITAFAHPMLAYYWPDALPDGGTVADATIWLFQFIFIDGKMRGLFTLLFGAGIVLFMERAWTRGGSRWWQVRRLAWLMVFGLLHFFLLFRGDILFTYSVWGLVALLFVRVDPIKQMTAGILLYMVGGIFLMLAMGADAWFEQANACAQPASVECRNLEEGLTAATRQIDQQHAVYGSGSFGDILSYTVNEQSIFLGKAMFFGMLETLPLMLMGMALYRFGLFDGGVDRAALRKWSWLGVMAGIALTLPLGLWVLASGFSYYLTSFVFNAASQIPRLPMMLGLAVLLVLWTPAIAGTAIGRRLVAAGRMAFSNYIGTSLVMMLVFHGWALGLYGKLGRLELLVVVLAGWAAMLAWSKPWLERFGQGPLERLWRSLARPKIADERR